MSKLTPYSYDRHPLEKPASIRLLRLRPASRGNGDLDCEIAVVDFLPSGSPPIAHIPESHAPIEYEAVSWCWGKEVPDQLLRIHDGDNVYSFYISRNLSLALQALRKHDVVRVLWIDAICINQSKIAERNEQVPRMDTIYGNSKNVCIWLGEGDENTTLAMNFIRKEVLKIWTFDKLIENREMAREWAALITLMKMPWFSRRWVVQEIALSPRGGTLYCGKEYVPWLDFADAVSLFVEVETATHRLSDVMKRDHLFDHIPDFFGDVSSLGAALLVDATSNLFRNSEKGVREPLSTLEYLVSRLSVFDATQPRDTIYALLAISKDTKPQNLEDDSRTSLAKKEIHALSLAKHRFASQPYNVDYKLPVIDVYQQFIEFSIRKSLDKTRALDIICRPWAPAVKESHDKPDFLTFKKRDQNEDEKKNDAEKGRGSNDETEEEEDSEIPLPSWIPSLSGAAFEMEEHPAAGLRMQRQCADPLVGMPETGQGNYRAAGTRGVELKKLRFKKWDSLKPKGVCYPDYSMFVEGFVLDKVDTVEQIAMSGNMPFQWLGAGDWKNTDKNPPDSFWRTLVADRGPGGRNPPTYFPRACREAMKFKAKTRSRDRGTLDCKVLINEGRCTIVAEFLRRVQAVIWNRVLIKTGNGHLGLAQDNVRPEFKVCILYGCSVPVILQEFPKTSQDIDGERQVVYEEWIDKRKNLITFLQKWRKAKLKDVQEKAAREKLAVKSNLQKSQTFPSNQDSATQIDTNMGADHAEWSQTVNLPPLETQHESDETGKRWKLMSHIVVYRQWVSTALEEALKRLEAQAKLLNSEVKLDTNLVEQNLARIRGHELSRPEVIPEQALKKWELIKEWERKAEAAFLQKSRQKRQESEQSRITNGEIDYGARFANLKNRIALIREQIYELSPDAMLKETPDKDLILERLGKMLKELENMSMEVLGKINEEKQALIDEKNELGGEPFWIEELKVKLDNIKQRRSLEWMLEAVKGADTSVSESCLWPKPPVDVLSVIRVCVQKAKQEIKRLNDKMMTEKERQDSKEKEESKIARLWNVTTVLGERGLKKKIEDTERRGLVETLCKEIGKIEEYSPEVIEALEKKLKDMNSLQSELKQTLQKLRERGKLESEQREGREKYEAERAFITPKWYKLFGECYVHNMMNGEAIAYQNDRNIQAEIFELR